MRRKLSIVERARLLLRGPDLPDGVEADRRTRRPWSLGRRAEDHKWPRIARDFWMFVITVIVLIALANASSALDAQRQGRRVALAVSCAVQSAVAQSGRAVIAGPPKAPSARMERALERLGFPPFPIRHAQNIKNAQTYVANISRRIDEQIGSKGDNLVRADGTIDCHRLMVIARAH